MKEYKKYIYYFSLFTTIIYILFRITYTIPKVHDISLFFAIVVLIIEIIDSIFFAIYTLNILTKDSEIPMIPKVLKKDYPELDVFIATINEDTTLIEETIKSCKKMKYPNKSKIHIYLCDDGRRKEMKDICQKHKINYISRKDNKDAKAGNYNHALKKTKSPYIVVFDADMKPTKDFLMKTIPYLFYNDKIGFVQLPQSFSNEDIYQKRFKLWNYIPFEQDYFYHRIQLSRNHNNSVIFCGTNAILSRKALEDIGGFATKTITEDFATGLMMERQEYKGIALPFDEAYGKNIENIQSLIKQRIRWCRGCLQTYKNYKILHKSGLTFKQKTDYLSGIYYWFFGIRNMIYLLVPLLFAYFNIRIIQCNIKLFLTFFLLQYVLKRFIIDILEKKEVSSTWNRIYEIILSPIILVESILEIIGITNTKFEVTKKNNNDKKTLRYYYLILTHIILFLLNFYGLYISIEKGLAYGFLEFIIPLFWLGTNCIYLLFAIIFDFSNSEEYTSDKNKSRQYKTTSTIILLFMFLSKEIKLKKIIIAISLIIVLLLGIHVNSYLQYQKKVILKQESLVSYNGKLSIKEGKIVNKYGKTIRLKGLSTHNLNWYERTYTKDNIKELVDTWGINIFRIAIYTNPKEEGYVANKELIKKIERIINNCIDLDVYIIVDWHILKDNNPNTYKKEAIEFFNHISKKYQDSPNIIYEICNEPNGEEVTWNEEIKPYANELIKVIRKNSKDSIIIVGLADWCKDIESALNSLIEENNIIYSVHFYAGNSIETNRKLKIDMQNAINNKMPMIITECGPTDPSGDGKLYKMEFNEWMKFLNQNKISWIIWQFSEKDEASSILIKKEVQDRLDFIHGKYTELELQRKKYHINDYLSDTGKYIKIIFKKYN